ncbi:MAG: SMP-30/gluconolactonase/LRE family protein [Actinobacteria bacterium]|nr:SMP-30/gluconolactonase/LRE family protein [Actinomycetota bacterium]
MTSEPAVYASGLRAPEGPAFDRAGRLFVVEMDAATVQRVDADGSLHPFVCTGARPNGLAFHRDGDLYVAEAGLGAVLRVPPSGRPYMFADAGDEPFRNPNDLAFDTDGGLYVTDPVKGSVAPDGRVYYIDPEGEVRLFADGLRFPNGVVLTADGGTVLVAESRAGAIRAYTLDAPGRAGTQRIRVELVPPADRGGPGGLAVAEDGHLYVALSRHGAVAVVAPDDTVVERIPVGADRPSNVAFGGPDRRLLFVTEVDSGTVRIVPTVRRGLALYGEAA